jgi:hypothetical protein
MNFKNKIKYISLIILIFLIIYSLKLLNIDKNEKFLNFFAEYYFNKQYYLTTYPEITNLKIEPFKH